MDLYHLVATVEPDTDMSFIFLQNHQHMPDRGKLFFVDGLDANTSKGWFGFSPNTSHPMFPLPTVELEQYFYSFMGTRGVWCGSITATIATMHHKSLGFGYVVAQCMVSNEHIPTYNARYVHFNEGQAVVKSGILEQVHVIGGKDIHCKLGNTPHFSTGTVLASTGQYLGGSSCHRTGQYWPVRFGS